MVRKLFLVLLVFFYLTNFFIMSRRIRKGKEQLMQQEQKQQQRREDIFEAMNICSIESNSESINCFCNLNNLLQATSATCWIFGNLNKSDSESWTRFKTQPNLASLTLTMRPMEVFTFIPTQIFTILTKLTNFDLKYASIATIEPYAFANLSSLVHLHLSRNKITSMSNYSFSNLINLLEIILEENQLTEIKRNVFYELPRLRKLFLGSNNISRIHDGAFKYLGSLLELELKQNSLMTINRDCFLGLSNLKRLDLSSNLINTLGDLTFAELWHLEELILESNQLKIVNRKAFFGLNHLKRLALNENYLITLDSRLFEDTPAINFLDLRANNLITLTLDNIRPIFSNFLNDSSYFFLERNKLECDCKLLWVFDLYNETRNKHIKKELEKLACYTKSDDDHFTSLRTPMAPLQNTLYNDYDDSYEYDNDYNNGNDNLSQLDNNQQLSNNNENKKSLSNVKKYFLFYIGRDQLTCKPVLRPLNDEDSSNKIAIKQQQSLSGVSDCRHILQILIFYLSLFMSILFTKIYLK